MGSGADRKMPFWVGDYLAQTLDLSTTEHGAYLLLLMHYWLKGPLADDDHALCNIAKLRGRGWRRAIARVRTFFQLYPDGLLHQKRMDAERERAGKLRKAAPASACAGSAPLVH